MLGWLVPLTLFGLMAMGCIMIAIDVKTGRLK